MIAKLLAAAGLIWADAAAATRNGDLDPNFGIDGVQIVDMGVNTLASGLDIAPDGKIILGGTFDGGVATNQDFAAARLNADGTIDTSFSFDGWTTVAVSAGAGMEQSFNSLVQPDGKIIIIGDALPTEGVGANRDMALVRFNVNGTLDTTFSGDGKAFVDFDLSATPDDRALDAVRLPDGKLIVVGGAAVTNEESDFAVAKLNADGSRDTSFDGDGRLTIRFNADPTHRFDLASSVAIDAEGRILVAGITAKGGGSTYDFALARLLPNGQLDANFSGDGRTTIAFDIGGNLDDEALELIVAPDGSIFLTGAAMDDGFDVGVAKLLPDGSLDNSFGGDGRVTVPFDLGDSNNDTFYGAALQPDGALVLAGSVQIGTINTDIGFVRLLPDGSLDPSFGSGGKAVVPLDLGGNLLDAALRVRYADGAMIFSGAANTGDYLSFLAGRVLIDVLFSDDFEDD